MRGTVITHTVGLCLPLWSLMLGEGLCPAASEYAAPSPDDCGGGGGGGGSASCKNNNREVISTKGSNIWLLRDYSASPPSQGEVEKQQQATRDGKALCTLHKLRNQLQSERAPVIWDIPCSLPAGWELGLYSPVPPAAEISQSSLFVCCWETLKL